MSRFKQRLGGVILMFLGAAFTGWCWQTALTQGYFYRKASMIFPAVFVVGLGLLIFPGYKEERIAQGEDISGLEGIHLITPRWWAILGLALISGVGNYLLLSMLI